MPALFETQAMSQSQPQRISTYLAYVRQPAHQQRLSKIDATSAAIVREPNNKAAAHACAVYVNKQMVGYLPDDVATYVSEVIDAGEWTYVIPHLRVRNQDGAFFANVVLESRRPGDGLIGREHAPVIASGPA